MGRVAVVTESAACVPPAAVEECDITVIPLNLVIKDKTYRDGIDISQADFYRALEEDFSAVSTSAPSIGTFQDAFRTLLKDHESVCCITLTSKMSGSHNAAIAAAEKIDDQRIAVLDSNTAACAEGMIVMEAAARANEDAGLQEVLFRANEVAEKVRLYAVIDTLDYLRKSGRVSQISAIAASTLNIKPVLQVCHGEAIPVAKTRSKMRALEKIARLAVDEYREKGPIKLAVFHALSPEDAAILLKRIKSESECVSAFTGEFTPVMGKHTGPGLAGASFFHVT